MRPLGPDTRTLSRRKLDFEETKLFQAATAKPLRKRACKTRSDVLNEPLISELDGSLLRDGKGSQKGPLTYRRRSRAVLVKDTVKNTVQPLHGIVNSPIQDSEMADFSLSTTGCLDVVSLDTDPLVHRIDTAIVYEGPYPSFPKPLPEECSEVCHRLSLLHGPLEEYARHKATKISDEEVLLLEHHKEEDTKGAPGSLVKGLQSLSPSLRRTVLDSLVGTILSQNTTDTNSRRAFASLKARFPTWEMVYEADPKAVEEAIRCGGLAEIKTSRILNILKTLDRERGKLCLEYVRELSTDEIKLELSRFKGVGPKTIACVLMFHLQQNEFPVDTHVFRITKMLGWVPAKADREKAYLHLNHRIPSHLKFDLHCLLVTHGKRCPRCAKGGRTQRPADGPCPLVNLNQDRLESAQYDSLPEPLERIFMDEY